MGEPVTYEIVFVQDGAEKPPEFIEISQESAERLTMYLFRNLPFMNAYDGTPGGLIRVRGYRTELIFRKVINP